MRLDVYLVEHGFFESRTRAQKAIEEQVVLVNGTLATKANLEISLDSHIELIRNVFPYVSRGGIKLEAAIENFQLDFQNKRVLDIGASTGGFTDCALKHGASIVYAVDVGTDQLDSTLRTDPRVISLEKTNILDVEQFPIPFDFIVMDVSFVSIEKLLPAIQRFLRVEASLICLIKPQYEIGKAHIKNGVVKDKHTHLKVLQQVDAALSAYQMGILKLIPSPILGGSGNKEFLAHIKKNCKTRVNLLEVTK